MNDVIQIIGKVKHKITLDPSVWIFDDRKKRPIEFFNLEPTDETQSYAEKMAKLWDKELKEGASVPTTQSEALFVQKKDISGDWAMPFRPFLANAVPEEGARLVICHLQEGQVEIPLSTAENCVLCFAIDGKPIRGEDGPIHLLFGDGSNLNEPVKGVQSFELV